MRRPCVSSAVMKHPGSMDLDRAIAAHLAEWDEAVVELAVFGTDEPARIGSILRRFVASTLGTQISECLFYRTSVGSVAGLVLEDRRRVVVKAHQPHVRSERLVAVHHVMSALAQAG